MIIIKHYTCNTSHEAIQNKVLLEIHRYHITPWYQPVQIKQKKKILSPPACDKCNTTKLLKYADIKRPPTNGTLKYFTQFTFSCFQNMLKQSNTPLQNPTFISHSKAKRDIHYSPGNKTSSEY